MLNAVHPGYRRVRARLGRLDGINLNLGSGASAFPGWVNIDVMRGRNGLTLPYDIRRTLPFQNEQIARIFAEHVVEHLDFKEDVPRLLDEFHRILKPGGWVRIIVPDAERWLDAYVTRDPAKWAALGFDELPPDMPTMMTMINHVFHQDGEHMFAYDFDTLQYALHRAGFRRIERMSFAESNDPHLSMDQQVHAAYSLYVEAQKEPRGARAADCRGEDPGPQRTAAGPRT